MHCMNCTYKQQSHIAFHFQIFTSILKNLQDFENSDNIECYHFEYSASVKLCNLPFYFCVLQPFEIRGPESDMEATS